MGKNSKSRSSTSLRKRILSGVFITALMTAFVAVIVSTNMKDLQASQNSLQLEQEKMLRLNQVFLYVLDMESGIRSYLLTGDTDLLAPFSKTEEILGAYIEGTNELFKDDQKQLDRLAALSPMIKKWVESSAVVEMLARRKLQAGMYDMQQFSDAIKTSPGAKMLADIKALLNEGIEAEKAAMSAQQKHTWSLTEKTVTYTLWGLAASILFGLVFQFFITHSLHNKLEGSVRDLVKVEDFIRKSASLLTQMGSSLKSSSEELNRSIVNSSSSMHEVSSMITQTKEHTDAGYKSAESSHHVAQSGENNVRDLIQSIGEIQNSSRSMTDEMKESNEKISEIVDVINEISVKTNVINDIVFQTKLLSFNASVEAARAGEHGKGFAVVAEEVGNLAQMSGQAANEISGILKSGIERTNSIVEEYSKRVEQSSSLVEAKIDAGVRVAEEFQESLKTVVENSHSVKQMLESIDSAVKEQSDGVNAISKESEHIDQISGSTLEIADQSNSQVKELEKLSDQLGLTLEQISTVFLGHSAIHEAPVDTEASKKLMFWKKKAKKEAEKKAA